ncbi:MAG TPA: hypothetical protein VNP92_04860 [Actinophytocola sp.]|nr:hypothetical protein [Actinophytocola sp.]
MALDMAALRRDLLDWVLDWHKGAEVEVDAGTNLLAAGLLDSMGLVGLVSYLEERADADFDFGTFDAGGDVSVDGLIGHLLGTGVSAE